MRCLPFLFPPFLLALTCPSLPHSPLVASTVDMVTPLVTPTGAGAPGITLQEDAGLAVLGWDKNWDVGIDWGAFIRGGGLEGAVSGDIESEFGSGVEREGEWRAWEGEGSAPS